MILPSWTSNPQWQRGLERGDTCTRVSFRFTPCGRPLPCPIHDVGFACEDPEAQWIEDQKEKDDR